MFIQVDSPSPSTSMDSLNQIIDKAQKYLHLLVEHELKESILEEWRQWFREAEEEHPNALSYFRDLKIRVNSVSSLPDGCERISSLSSKTQVELLNHIIDTDPISIQSPAEIETKLGGLIPDRSSVRIFDRYLLKHRGERLEDMANTSAEGTPLNNLIVLLKAMNDRAPRDLAIYTEFFQMRERPSGMSQNQYEELINSNEYEDFASGLMKSLVEKIRSHYSVLDGTKIEIFDCTRLQYRSGSLAHDRYLELNRMVMVSTGGFNFTIPGHTDADYEGLVSLEADEIPVSKINPPTVLLPVRSFAKKPRGALVKFVAERR